MNAEVMPAESTAVSVRSASPFDGNVAEFKGALVRRGENRKSLIDWIRGALVDGVDFGKIHTTKRASCKHGGPPACTPDAEPYHWSKPSLRKPGAEKICGMLGVTATFPTIKDYESAALNGLVIGSIILRCHLLTADGQIVADGVGARNVDQDYGDLNKALKMVCKSAHIDATLRMAGLSEIFTQDLEDMPRADADPQERQPERQTQTQAPRANGGRGFATEKQVGLIVRRLEIARLSEEELLKHFDFNSVSEVPFAKVNEVLDWIANATE